MADNYQSFDISVAGGSLRVGSWGSGGRTVLAVHGLTANHKVFHIVADALGPEYTVIAPDLRGRGASRDVGQPYGITQHAEDVASLLQTRGTAVDVALGHSMGGYVVLQLAHAHPELVHRLVLVDGGLPREALTEHGETAEPAYPATPESVRTRIGPAFERLEMTFETVEAYLEFWRNHPAFIDDWNPYVEESYTYDLVGEPPSLHTSVNKEAVLADFAGLPRARVGETVHHLNPPVTFVRAPRGLQNDIPPLYPDDILEHWGKELPDLRILESPDVNHYTVVIGTSGAQFLADVIRKEGTLNARGPI